jgi:hypothetical protein
MVAVKPAQPNPSTPNAVVAGDPTRFHLGPGTARDEELRSSDAHLRRLELKPEPTLACWGHGGDVF